MSEWYQRKILNSSKQRYTYNNNNNNDKNKRQKQLIIHVQVCNHGA